MQAGAPTQGGGTDGMACPHCKNICKMHRDDVCKMHRVLAQQWACATPSRSPAKPPRSAPVSLAKYLCAHKRSHGHNTLFCHPKPRALRDHSIWVKVRGSLCISRRTAAEAHCACFMLEDLSRDSLLRPAHRGMHKHQRSNVRRGAKQTRLVAPKMLQAISKCNQSASSLLGAPRGILRTPLSCRQS